MISVSLNRWDADLDVIPNFYLSVKPCLSVLHLSLPLSVLVDWLVNPLAVESVNRGLHSDFKVLVLWEKLVVQEFPSQGVAFAVS